MNLFYQRRHRRRRSRDPYAESFRERHALGINAVKRWSKRILFVTVLYGLYLLAIWLIFPWGEVTSTPTGRRRPPSRREFSEGSFPKGHTEGTQGGPTEASPGVPLVRD